jgi:excisionase family DNA binding protein
MLETTEQRTYREEVLTPDELAEFLRCGKSYARELLRDGSIPSFKLGKLRRVLRRDAERYVEQLIARDS